MPAFLHASRERALQKRLTLRPVRHIREILALLWKLLRQNLKKWLGELLGQLFKKLALYAVVALGFVVALVLLLKTLLS